jgi:cell cycle arrest protein BUB3
MWDPRASTAQVSSHDLPERVYRTAITGNTLVVALASRLFRLYDVRNLGAGPTQERESSLKFMTRSLACMATGQGFATGSVEGRIAVEYFDPSPEAQAQKYAFKCHRATVDDVDHVWPVNALVFHPMYATSGPVFQKCSYLDRTHRYNTFASAGSDGTLSLWDHSLKKRLRQYPKYNGGISTLDFNSDGSRLAIGVGDTWDDGVEPSAGTVTPSILVRMAGDEAKVCTCLFSIVSACLRSFKPKGWSGP